MTDEAAAAENALVYTKIHMWWVWMKIAATHVGDARRARGGQATAASFEAGEAALKLGREVIAQCAAAVSANNATPAAASIAKELPDVLNMVDELIATRA